MNYKLNYSPKKIYGKQFEVVTKGYYPDEVDAMLDMVIQDYDTFSKIIGDDRDKIEALENENAALKQELEELKKAHIVSEENVKKLETELSPQVDVLKRLSALEKNVLELQKQVFGEQE